MHISLCYLLKNNRNFSQAAQKAQEFKARYVVVNSRQCVQIKIGNVGICLLSSRVAQSLELKDRRKKDTTEAISGQSCSEFSLISWA